MTPRKKPPPGTPLCIVCKNKGTVIRWDPSYNGPGPVPCPFCQKAEKEKK